MNKMFKILNYISVLFAILSLKSSVNCENNNNNNNANNSRMTKLFERHSENIRKSLCGQKGITSEQWANLKSECINPRINQLVPENAINVWQECSERVIDLCDDQQWMGGKDCAREMLQDKDIQELQMWYKTRVRQMSSNFKMIKTCYQQQRKDA